MTVTDVNKVVFLWMRKERELLHCVLVIGTRSLCKAKAPNVSNLKFVCMYISPFCKKKQNKKKHIVKEKDASHQPELYQ